MTTAKFKFPPNLSVVYISRLHIAHTWHTAQDMLIGKIVTFSVLNL